MIEMNHIFTTTMMKHVLASVALMLITTAPTTQAAEGEDHILKPGQFPPPNSGTYLAGAACAWMGTLAAIITWITSPCYPTT